MWLNYVWSVGDYALSFTGKLDRQQWILVFFAALVVGFLFTRGFGSRSQY